MAATKPVTIVELKVPTCSLTHGTSPCTATGTPCYNTLSTCQDTENFTKSTQSLWFVEENDNWRSCTGFSQPIPALLSVSTTPTKINFSGLDESYGGFGRRSTKTIRIRDFTYNDALTDKYRSTRGYDPKTRGTFWLKYIARNEHRIDIEAIVYTGVSGQDVSAMQKSECLWSKITHPNDGAVTIQTTDWLAKLDPDSARVVDASPGELARDLSATDTAMRVSDAVASDYPAAGLVRVGDEIMRYDAITNIGQNLNFNLTERGAWGTTAASHDADASVQECAEFDATISEAIQDLLDRGGFPSARIDTAALAAEVDTYLAIHRVFTVIADTELSVSDALQELTVQYGLHTWYDERRGMITFGVARDINADASLLTEGAHIMQGSFSIEELPKQWISSVWFYYALRSPVSDMDDIASYKTVYVAAGSAAGDYGQERKREIRSRWVASAAMARGVANRTLRRFSQIPLKCTFTMAPKDSTYWAGDIVSISTRRHVDEHGLPKVENWFITGASPLADGSVKYEARNLRTHYAAKVITPNGTPDYTPGVSDPTHAFIGDSDGKLSDGADAMRLF